MIARFASDTEVIGFGKRGVFAIQTDKDGLQRLLLFALEWRSR